MSCTPGYLDVVESVIKSLRVVEALSDAGEAGVSELARRTTIPKSTVQRCLNTLAEAGWIVTAGPPTDPAGTRWRLSAKVQRIAARVDDRDVRDLARPVMIELRDRTGETIHLTALEDRQVVLLDRVAGTGPVQVVLPIGHRVPAHAGATGKAILAALDLDALDRYLTHPLERLTASTIADADELRGELDEIRRTGWATNRGEWDQGVAAVAAAIVVEGAPVGALSISSTPERLPPERMNELGPLVVAAARRIAALS
jgi:IclR family acetate operon transcriptional repressor